MSKDINETVLTEMSRHVLCTTTNAVLMGNINNTCTMHHNKHDLFYSYKLHVTKQTLYRNTRFAR